MATIDTGEDKVCLHCGNELAGKQHKFCSERHKNLYWSVQRARAFRSLDATPGSAGTDEDMQELWSAFCGFIKREKSLLLKILQR